jgi:acetate kinase
MSSPPRVDLVSIKPDLTTLALNSGSSSLKFGLSRVGSARTEILLFGEAESIGEKKGKFHTQDSGGNALLSGVSLDEAARHRFRRQSPISDPASRCEVLVLGSQEDQQIARHTWALLAQSRFR